MMFGYATNETDNYMPLALDLSHALLLELAAIRRENNEITYLRPDAKSQVTLEYSDDNKPVRIDAIVISTQHDDFADEATMLAKIKSDLISILIPRVKAKYPFGKHHCASLQYGSICSEVHRKSVGTNASGYRNHNC